MTRVLILLVIAMLAACGGGSAGNDRVSISTATAEGPLTLTSLDANAGAISSLTWRGCEFINSTDHGRLLQSAVQLNGQGEAVNPTEAGGSYDPQGRSSSVKLTRIASASELDMLTQMAWWFKVGGESLSPHTLGKSVQIAWQGNSNVIKYITTFTLAGAPTQARFEYLTGYMPTSFSHQQALDVADGTLIDLSAEGNFPSGTHWPAQALPLIFSKPDGSCAMGVFSPDATAIGYEYFTFPDTVKWAVASPFIDNPQSVTTATTFLFVGSVARVRADMLAMLR